MQSGIDAARERLPSFWAPSNADATTPVHSPMSSVKVLSRPLHSEPGATVVTAGAWFVGTNLVPHYLSADGSVVVAHNRCRGNRSNLCMLFDHSRLRVVDAEIYRRLRAEDTP
jgi:hypothetical protein